jgi:sugar lactone lactonase YvrE
VAGGQDYGSSLTQLSNPNGIIVDKLGTIYLTDSDNNRVMRWSKGAREGYIVVDGNEKKEQSNQLQYPMGL